MKDKMKDNITENKPRDGITVTTHKATFTVLFSCEQHEAFNDDCFNCVHGDDSNIQDFK